MSKPEQLEKLLNYAINPPENDDKRSAAYVYSAVAGFFFYIFMRIESIFIL